MTSIKYWPIAPHVSRDTFCSWGWGQTEVDMPGEMSKQTAPKTREAESKSESQNRWGWKSLSESFPTKEQKENTFRCLAIVIEVKDITSLWRSTVERLPNTLPGIPKVWKALRVGDMALFFLELVQQESIEQQKHWEFALTTPSKERRKRFTVGPGQQTATKIERCEASIGPSSEREHPITLLPQFKFNAIASSILLLWCHQRSGTCYQRFSLLGANTPHGELLWGLNFAPWRIV